MSRKGGLERSVGQRVANRGRELRLRLLGRLGKSSQASESFLMGGVLVAHLVDGPHRFTRDIDFLRRHGPADPDDIRRCFREVLSVRLNDGVDFDPTGVRAVAADRDEDGYDGVKVFVRARVAGHPFDLRVHVGFGDAVAPPATCIQLAPSLDDDEPAPLLAYEAGSVLAEKIETLIAKFPVLQHRLKDLLDVVILSATLDFDGAPLTASLRATLDRRGTRPDLRVLDELRTELTGRRWPTDWATMLREEAVAQPMELADAIARFETLVPPRLDAVGGGEVERSVS